MLKGTTLYGWTFLSLFFTYIHISGVTIQPFLNKIHQSGDILPIRFEIFHYNG